MAIKINYLKNTKNKSSSNLVLFSDEKFKINNLKKHLLGSEFNYISDLLQNVDTKKNLHVFELNSKKKIVLISLKNNLKNSEVENLGAEFYGRINSGKNTEYFLNSDSISSSSSSLLSDSLLSSSDDDSFLSSSASSGTFASLAPSPPSSRSSSPITASSLSVGLHLLFDIKSVFRLSRARLRLRQALPLPSFK